MRLMDIRPLPIVRARRASVRLAPGAAAAPLTDPAAALGDRQADRPRPAAHRAKRCYEATTRSRGVKASTSVSPGDVLSPLLWLKG
jgi:hypothetical protein